jgi:S-adenosylmethionine/arginine decarboxylase-like enzyme
MANVWGYSLMLNCGECCKGSIRSKYLIKAFSKQLVKNIDMVAYGDPQVVHFGTGNKAGYTLVQLIETSNITAHFVEETNSMYLDVFSCKNFDVETVESTVKQFFDPQYMSNTFTSRGDPSPDYELK